MSKIPWVFFKLEFFLLCCQPVQCCQFNAATHKRPPAISVLWDPVPKLWWFVKIPARGRVPLIPEATLWQDFLQEKQPHLMTRCASYAWASRLWPQYGGCLHPHHHPGDIYYCFDEIPVGLMIVTSLPDAIHSPLSFKPGTHCRTLVHMTMILVVNVAPSRAVRLPFPSF